MFHISVLHPSPPPFPPVALSSHPPALCRSSSLPVAPGPESVASSSARSRSLVDEHLRRSVGEREREVAARRAVHVRSGGDDEKREATASRVSVVVTSPCYYTQPTERGEREARAKKTGGGGARLVRAHGGEKSRAPHPPRQR